MNVASYIANFISIHSEKYIFWISSIPNLPIYEELNKFENIKIVQNVHEANSIYSSIWWYLATWKIHFCIVTAGPWVTNCITAISDAYVNTVPLFIISINNNSDFYWLWEKHDSSTSDLWVDTVWILKNITSYSSIVLTPENLTYVLDYAYKKSLYDKKPVHISIPKDFLKISLPENTQVSNLNHYNNLSYNDVYKTTSLSSETKKSISQGSNSLIFINSPLSEKDIHIITKNCNEKNLLICDSMWYFWKLHHIESYMWCWEYIQNITLEKILKHIENLIIIWGDISKHLFEKLEQYYDKNILHFWENITHSENFKLPKYTFNHLVDSHETIKYIFTSLPIGKYTKNDIKNLQKISNKYYETHYEGILSYKFIKDFNNSSPERSNIFVSVWGINNIVNVFSKNLNNSKYFLPSRFFNMWQSLKAVWYAHYDRKNPTFILTGDGNFYMNGFDIITCIEQWLNINFIVFNNKWYGSLTAHSKKDPNYKHKKEFNQYKSALDFRLFAKSVWSGYFCIKEQSDIFQINKNIDYHSWVNIIEIICGFNDNIPL